MFQVMEFDGDNLVPNGTRKLDPTKIDFHELPDTNSSMIKRGVYPEGTSREQVEKVVRGTFGGRFQSFEGGAFTYIAYTD